jgi:hypothetical protein
MAMDVSIVMAVEVKVNMAMYDAMVVAVEEAEKWL